MDASEGNVESHLPVTQGSGRRGASRPQLTAADLASGGNLDKIRDILFGTQMRDMEKHFARLEERLLKDLTELKEETRGRFASLEEFLKREMESLTDQLKTEQNTRHETVQALTQEIKETTRAVEQRTQQAEEHIVRTQRELRQHILDQSRTLRDEFWDRYRELSETTDRSMQELRVEKIDRATLAVLLTELAMRLGNEYLMPGNE